MLPPLPRPHRRFGRAQPCVQTARTSSLPDARMQITPEQGHFLSLLVRLVGARQVLEIGTFTGYSALAMALALPPGGRLTACDVSEEWTSIGRQYWAQAGVADKIDLHLAPAKDTLALLEMNRITRRFDLIFVDADKTGYEAYYEVALRLIRPGGLIVLDYADRLLRMADEAVTDLRSGKPRGVFRLGSLAAVGVMFLLLRGSN